MWSIVHFCPFVNVFLGGTRGERSWGKGERYEGNGRRSWGKGEEGEAREIITARRVVDISKTYCGVGAGPVLLPLS